MCGGGAVNRWAWIGGCSCEGTGTSPRLQLFTYSLIDTGLVQVGVVG